MNLLTNLASMLTAQHRKVLMPTNMTIFKSPKYLCFRICNIGDWRREKHKKRL